MWTQGHEHQIYLCVKLYLNDHNVCKRVLTYWTRRNRRDEFLVPGFELVNFNDRFLDFNWLLFNWNGDFFLCKSNEKDAIKKIIQEVPRKGKIILFFMWFVTAAKSGTDLVLAWRQMIPSSASGWACSRLAHPALSSHNGPANKHEQENCWHSLKLWDCINKRRFCTCSQNDRPAWCNCAFCSRLELEFLLDNEFSCHLKMTAENLSFIWNSRTVQENPKFLRVFSRRNWKLCVLVDWLCYMKLHKK